MVSKGQLSSSPMSLYHPYVVISTYLEWGAEERSSVRWALGKVMRAASPLPAPETGVECSTGHRVAAHVVLVQLNLRRLHPPSAGLCCRALFMLPYAPG